MSYAMEFLNDTSGSLPLPEVKDWATFVLALITAITTAILLIANNKGIRHLFGHAGFTKAEKEASEQRRETADAVTRMMQAIHSLDERSVWTVTEVATVRSTLRTVQEILADMSVSLSVGPYSPVAKAPSEEIVVPSPTRASVFEPVH